MKKSLRYLLLVTAIFGMQNIFANCPAPQNLQIIQTDNDYWYVKGQDDQGNLWTYFPTIKNKLATKFKSIKTSSNPDFFFNGAVANGNNANGQAMSLSCEYYMFTGRKVYLTPNNNGELFNLILNNSNWKLEKIAARIIFACPSSNYLVTECPFVKS